MLFLCAVLVASSVVGGSAQQARCTPRSFAASSLIALEFKVYHVFSDADRQLTLSDDISSDRWRLVDMANHVVYTYTGINGCVKNTLEGDMDVSRAEIYANAEFQYDLTLPGGAVLRAWTYTRGNLTVNLLFDPDCISVLTTVSFNGVPHMIDLLEDVQIDNLDLSQLDARYEQVQDPAFCRFLTLQVSFVDPAAQFCGPCRSVLCPLHLSFVDTASQFCGPCSSILCTLHLSFVDTAAQFCGPCSSILWTLQLSFVHTASQFCRHCSSVLWTLQLNFVDTAAWSCRHYSSVL
ncbi:hypothetical protein RRG08_060087 [Elysia crispata]|uniref:Uncharacterized protein n=1 Tax=Elysia crispata TaxID=231223 RepID=A0AAE1ACZ2_9GAST|nr:hypothetical protein RRG08_060087 [Elysia crispata]